MRNGFVAVSSDLSRLRETVLDKLEPEQLVCSSLNDIDKLRQVEKVYFVISAGSMCSTAYQELVFAVLDSIQDSHRRLLFLDEVEIPAGFSQLRTLPRETPE